MSRCITLHATETLITETCFSCGVLFAMTEDMRNRRLEDKKNFYCPNGHSQHYLGKTEAEKLAEKLAATEKQLEYARTARKSWQDQAEAAERRRVAQLGANTKLRKRVANGVCPCCKRSFADLHRHMTGQHPDFVSVG